MNEANISLLPGQIASALLLAAVLAYPLARLLLWRYVRVVEQTMRTASPLAASATAISPPVETRRAIFTGGSDAVLHQLWHAPWHSAAIQAGVAILIGLYFGTLQLIAGDIDLSIYRVIAFAATHVWPGVLAVLLIAGISRRQRVIVLLVGAGLYLTFGVWAHTGSFAQALKEVLLLWAITNLPPSLYLLAFMTRRVRAVGPLVLLVSLVTVAGVQAAFALMMQFPDAGMAVAGLLLDAGFSAIGVLLAYALIGGGLALVLGLWLLRKLADAYARYRVGDEGLALAALWLVFIMINSITLVFEGTGYFLLGLAAFPVYLILVRVARRLFLPTASSDAPALLLLRVFAREGPTAGLFRAINRHWRHVGPIRMIAGYDLASEAIEPDEMMAFLRRRLADSFVTGPEVVQRRLDGNSEANQGTNASRRDADARYRSEEFFCFDNTWRDTLQRLVASSAVILMDLRGFGPENKGCIFELEELAACGALPRTLLVHDATTKMPTLHEALDKIGVDAAALNLLPVEGDESRDIAALLLALAKHAV